MSKHGIIGPFFFEDERGNVVTVRKEPYVKIIELFWEELGERDVDKDEQWFQQDGAPPHTANITMDWLKDHFGERLISRRANTEWSPHSPDLNPPDFFLWGFLKDKIYQNNPQTIQALKTAITANIQTISQDECVRVINNFARRIQECLRLDGGHLEHII